MKPKWHCSLKIEYESGGVKGAPIYRGLKRGSGPFPFSFTLLGEKGAPIYRGLKHCKTGQTHPSPHLGEKGAPIYRGLKRRGLFPDSAHLHMGEKGAPIYRGLKLPIVDDSEECLPHGKKEPRFIGD